MRYLCISRDANRKLRGNAVELLLHAAATAPADTAALLAQLYSGYQRGDAAAPAQGEGIFLVYSAGYHYRLGRHFRAGQWQPRQVRLWFQPAAAGSRPDQPAKGRTVNRVNICIFYYSATTGEYLGSSAGCTLSPDDGGYSGDGGGYTGPGGFGGSGGDSPDNPNDPGSGPQGPTGGNQIAAIDQSRLTPCQTQVMQRLQAASGAALLGIVKLFSGTEPGYNWVVQNGPLPAGTYGDTNSLYNTSTRSVTTTFDAGHWGDATDLSIARTMLHEAVHAYLIAYFANSK